MPSPSIQPSFAAGEISSALYSRVDINAYFIALRRALNVMVLPQGGVVSRPGGELVGYCKEHTYAPRLVRWKHGSGSTFWIELGNAYARFIKNGGYVTEATTTITNATQANPVVVTTSAAHGYANGDAVFIDGVVGMTELNGRWFTVANKAATTFELTHPVTGANVNGTGYTAYSSAGTAARVYTLTTPWDQDEVWDLDLHATSSVMAFAHQDHDPRELRRQLALDVTNVTQANPGVVTTSAAHGLTTGQEVVITEVVGMTQLNGRTFTATVLTSTTFSIGANTTSYTAYSSGGKVTYSSDITWTLSAPTFDPDIDPPTSVSGTATATGSTVYQYQVTAIAADTLEESLPGLGDTTDTTTSISQANPAVVTATAHPFANGDVIHIQGAGGMTELNGRYFEVANATANSFELLGEDSSGYGAFTGTATLSLTWDSIANGNATPGNVISFTRTPGATKHAVYRRQGNKRGVFGFVGETKTDTFRDDNIAPDYSINPPTQRLPFRGSGNKPGAVGLYQQRRVYGGTANAPDTSEFSKPGALRNFSTSEAGANDDAFALTLDADEVSRIRHYARGRKLLTLTEASEFSVHFQGATDGFNVTTAAQDPETTHGIGSIPPLTIGERTLIVQKLGRRVYDLSFTFASDSYAAVDLTALADHITRSSALEDWTYAETPHSLVATVRADGYMPVMTFKPEHRVTAWARWYTDGTYESVAAGPDDLAEDTIYYVVKRVIGGNNTYFVERFRPRFIDGDVQDYFGVDCGKSLDSPITITNVTAANPVVITTDVAHGLSNGDSVSIDDVTWEPTVDSDYGETQPAQLNKLGPFTVANKTATTFELSGVDGSAYNAYVGGGEVRLRVATVTGLWHLEGETDVAVLYDGSVALDQTITNGSWTVPNSGKASRVHVGKRYLCEVETLDIESKRGTIQGARKHIPFVHTRLEDTAGVLVGPDSSNMTPLQAGEVFTGGTQATLLNGDYKTVLEQHWYSSGRLTYRQPYPLPMAILAVIPSVSVGGS